MRKSAALILAGLTSLYSFQAPPPPKFVITADVQAALDHVRADSLRGDLSFIASDLLEGRNTPSRGLDVAAEYIAAQFRRAGLEPAGDDGYFQTAHMALQEPNLDGFELKLSDGEHVLNAAPTDVVVNAGALDLKAVPIFKLDLSDQTFVEGFTPDQVLGKVVVAESRPANQANARAALQKLRNAKPALIVTISRAAAARAGTPAGRLVDPSEPSTATPRIALAGEAAGTFYDSLKPGLSGGVATFHLEPPHEKPVTPRNVLGILRGSDPALKDTYVLVTAHYDHLGMRPDGPGDRIYNGANDDGSGTVSVIELARSLSTLKQRPRRSIVFMTFFGEEKGLLGSKYYARHPTLPIQKIVGQLNLEQVGRTDSSEGPQIANASVTGFDYSTLTDYVLAAGELTGIKVFKHPRNSDLYFSASDNASLAEAGVPAHTLSVTYQFPDYHKVGDEWQKVDYENMAKVDKMAALAVVMLANSEEPPRWNEANPKTAAYVKVWKERQK